MTEHINSFYIFRIKNGWMLRINCCPDLAPHYMPDCYFAPDIPGIADIMRDLADADALARKTADQNIISNCQAVLDHAIGVDRAKIDARA